MKQSDMEATLIGHYGDDMTVANAARVSFHKEANNYTQEQNEKLIKYLATHKHFSPFNHTFLSFRIKAPIFVARQLVKHRFMPWNEVSRRYVDDEPEFYFPGNGNWRKKADNVKQGSGEIGAKLLPLYEGQEDLWGDVDNAFDPDLHVSLATQQCFDMYQDLIESGVCAEQARMVLPQNMMTEWMWSGTLGAYCDMLRLRLDPHTQYESRIVAKKIRGIIEPLFPVSVKALLDV